MQPHLDRPTTLIVGDVDDVFVPMSDGLFVDPLASRYVYFPVRHAGNV